MTLAPKITDVFAKRGGALRFLVREVRQGALTAGIREAASSATGLLRTGRLTVPASAVEGP